MKQSSLTDRTLKGFAWLFLGRGGQAVLNLLVLAVLARYIIPADFGVVAAAMVIVGFSQIFAEVGVGPALVRLETIDRAYIATAFSLSIAIALGVGFVVFLLAPLFASFFRMPELTDVARVLSVLFPITGFSVVNQSLMQRSMKFKQLATIDIVAYAIGYGCIGVTLAVAGFQVWALVLAQLASSTVKSLLLGLINRSDLSIGVHPDRCRHLLQFGAGFSLSRIASYIALQADNLVVGRIMGPVALGLYGRAYQFLMAPTNLLGTLADNVLFPAMASVQTDRERLNRAYMRATATIAMLTFPLAGLLVAIAPEIVWIVLGAEWAGVVAPLQILASVLVFRVAYKVSSCLIRAKGMVYHNAWRQWIYAIAVTLGAWIGTRGGLSGVAIGVSAAIVLNYSLMLHLSLKVTGIALRDVLIVFARHFLVGVLIAIVAFSVRRLAVEAQLHPFLVLAVTSACSALAMCMLCWKVARIFGAEGAWFASVVRVRSSRSAGRLEGDPKSSN